MAVLSIFIPVLGEVWLYNIIKINQTDMIILKGEHELISQKCTIVIFKLVYVHLEAKLSHHPDLVITMRDFE